MLNIEDIQMRVARWLVLFAFLLVAPAYAQSTLLQAGPITPGHTSMYVNSGSSQAIVQDAGGAAGGVAGATLSELGVTVRGTGVPPYANAGTGPNGENICDYDAPIINATGGHSLCLSANAQGGGLISYQAFGPATALPLYFDLNGVKYQFPGTGSGNVVGPVSTTSGDIALWNNGVGTLLSDSGKMVPAGSIVGTTDTQTLTNKSISGSSNTFSNIPESALSAITADSLLGNASGSSSVPGVVNLTSCSSATNALTYSTSSHSFGCNSISGVLTAESFGSVASLVAATIPSIVQTVTTAGYYAAGDSGGQTYVRAASQPTKPCYQQSADGAYWDLPDRSTINVKACGARGDGTDDTTFIQNAISALNTNSGLTTGTITYPFGNYACASTCYNLLNQSNIHFIGSSSTSPNVHVSSTLAYIGASTTTPLIKEDGSEGITFSNFDYTCPSATYTGPLIDLRKTAGSVFTNNPTIEHGAIWCTTGSAPFSAVGVNLGNTIGAHINDIVLYRLGVGIQGAISGGVSNNTSIDLLSVQNPVQIPICAGGQIWSISNGIFEAPTTAAGLARAIDVSTLGINSLLLTNDGFYDAQDGSGGDWIDTVDDVCGTPGISRSIQIAGGLFNGGNLNVNNVTGFVMNGATIATTTNWPYISTCSGMLSVNITGNSETDHAGGVLGSAEPVCPNTPSSGNYIIDNMDGTSTKFH